MPGPRTPVFLVAVVLFSLALAGCGYNGSSDDDGGTATYSVGGAVGGLDGTLVLQNNGGDDLTMTEDGSFTFAAEVADGAGYTVAVSSQPSGQTCTVNNGTGAIAGADVSDVAVVCSEVSFSVAGTVSGLSGTLVLQNNGGDDLTMTEDGSFTFAAEVADGAGYEVAVSTQPSGQTCTVNDGTGTIDGADVSDVAVICSAEARSVGGAVSGLDGTLVLQNNGGDDTTITEDGPFTFAAEVADGAGYEVAVSTQPSGQACAVSNGTGTVDGADVTDVAVACSAAYSIGGTVGGLSGTLVLQNNGGDDTTITEDGPFAFANGLADGAGYSVAIYSGPSNQNCALSNEAGTVSGSDVSDVSVSCSDKAWTLPSSTADNISPDAQNASYPQAAMDDDGNAIVAWYQSNGSNNQIFMSEYRGGAWTHPADLTDNISPDGYSTSGSPRVAMDNNGNAIVVWSQYNGSHYQIFMSEYRGGVWTHPSDINDNISPDVQSAYSPRVAMDNNGNAIVVWYQSDGSNTQIFMSEYRDGEGWTHPADLTDNVSPDGYNTFGSPAVAMGNNGNAVIAWGQNNGSNWQVYKSECRGGVWTVPSDINDNISPDVQNAYSPQVAMDDDGNAVVVWYQSDGSRNRIFKSEYRGGVWTHPADLSDNISPDEQGASSPLVAMDNNGNAIIAWGQFDGSYNQRFISEYRAGVWTHPADLTDNISPDDDTWGHQVAMDNNGNAVVVWNGFDGSAYYGTFMSEYRNGAWSHPSLSDAIHADGFDGWDPTVAMGDNGDAIITWYQSDGSRDQVFISEYR